MNDGHLYLSKWISRNHKAIVYWTHGTNIHQYFIYWISNKWSQMECFDSVQGKVMVF